MKKKINEFVIYITIAIQRNIEILTFTIHIYKYFMFDFNEKCKKAIMKVNKLYKRYQNTRSQKNWKNYVIARNWKKTFITKIKKRVYRKFKEKACESFIIMWKISKLARRFDSSSQACILSIRKENGSLKDNSMNKLKILKKSFFPIREQT